MADFEAIIKKHVDEEGNIPASAINAIVTAIRQAVGNEYVDKERYKGKLTEIDTLKEQLATAEDNATTAGKWEEKYNELDGEWKKKFDDLSNEYSAYKDEQTAKETKAKKVEAYKGLLRESGLPEKFFSRAIKGADIDGIQFDDDGNVKDADALKEAISDEWADCFTETKKRGVKVDTPPANTHGDKRMTIEEIEAIEDTKERQRAMYENRDLYGI